MKHLLDILPQAFRRRGAGVALTLLLRAGLNFVGLAVLLPVLALVLDPAGVGGGHMEQVQAWLGIGSQRGFALAVCGAVVAVIVLKNLLNLWLFRVERNYTYDLYRTLSRQLYVAYHSRGLPFIKASNSSVLARNVNVVCLAFTAGVLRPAASIAAEALLMLMLFGALLLYTPVAALLAAGVFAPAVWGYYALVRKRINRYGELENRAQREKARLVAETFRGYSDIEVNDAFPMMLRRFDRAMDEVVRTRRSEATIGMLPQTFTEIGLAVGLAALVAWSLGSGQEHAQLLFGVFAVAALRLMPSVRSILSAWASIRYNRYTIDILRDAAGVGADDASSAEPMPFEREISVEGLRFRFEEGAPELFGGLSFSIRKGEYIGIRGTSGAGKTTFINLLLGFYTPTEGTIAVDGVALTSRNRRAWQNRIGYVSQHLFLVDGSFAANVALGVPDAEIDRARVAEALEAAQLGQFVAGLTQGVDTPIGECGCRLSGGQRQRIGIARALYRRADVLLFDEATSELDSATEQEINRSINRIAAHRPGLTLIVIAHRESSLEGCGRILEIGK